MFNLQFTAIAFAVGLALGGGSAWKITADYKDNQYAAATAKQKIEAAVVLQAATERAIAAERANIKLADKVEVEHAANKTKLDKITADNRRLSRELGGLRDPGLRPSCDCTVSATPVDPSQPTVPASGSRLSDEASEFLLEFARQADIVAEYAQACYRWVTQVGGAK